MYKTLCIDDETKFKGVRYGNIVAATNDVADYVNIRMDLLKGELIRKKFLFESLIVKTFGAKRISNITVIGHKLFCCI